MALGLVAASALLVFMLLDVAQILEARQAAYASFHGGGSGSGKAAPAAKVALLFLTRGDLPTEPLWRLFLQSAGEAPQQWSLAAQGRKRRHGSAGSAGSTEPAWPQLFTLYTHPPPGHRHPNSSIFAGHEVPNRVQVEWGQHSMIDAERALLTAALRGPANQRFVLLSDSCIPLYPAPLIAAQLLSENRSRINACTNDSDPQDAQKRMVYRWTAAMGELGLPRDKWRKSSQWVMLTQPHAELVAEDIAIDTAFRRECWSAPNLSGRFCASDEHYIPTLLAVRGLEAEAYCSAWVTYTQWSGRDAHPRTFGKGQATAEVLAEMRASRLEDASVAAASAEAAARLLRFGVSSGDRQALAGLPEAPPLLQPGAALFARKVAADAVPDFAALLLPVMQPG